MPPSPLQDKDTRSFILFSMQGRDALEVSAPQILSGLPPAWCIPSLQGPSSLILSPQHREDPSRRCPQEGRGPSWSPRISADSSDGADWPSSTDTRLLGTGPLSPSGARWLCVLPSCPFHPPRLSEKHLFAKHP